MATTLEEKAYSPKVGETQTQNSFTPEEEKQVLRKIDRVILPMVRTSFISVEWSLSNDSRCALSFSYNIWTSNHFHMLAYSASSQT